MLPEVIALIWGLSWAECVLCVVFVFCQCEKEGKASDYGASKPEGKNILKYVLEYQEGTWTSRLVEGTYDSTS